MRISLKNRKLKLIRIGKRSLKNVVNFIINGIPTLTYVSAREISATENMNYTQSMYSYTHGFGVVMNEINAVNKDGEVEILLNEMKPEVSVGDLKITEPRIYFGEEDNRPVVVNADKIDEFDYSEIEEDARERVCYDCDKHYDETCEEECTMWCPKVKQYYVKGGASDEL